MQGLQRKSDKLKGLLASMARSTDTAATFREAVLELNGLKCLGPYLKKKVVELSAVVLELGPADMEGASDIWPVVVVVVVGK